MYEDTGIFGNKTIFVAMDQHVFSRILEDGHSCVVFDDSIEKQVHIEPWYCVRGMAGWRRTHFYKLIVTHKLLTLGFDVFTLDMDRGFPGENLNVYLTLPDDVIVFDIGVDNNGLLNMGGYLVKSSARTIGMYRSVTDNIYGWDQLLWSKAIEDTPSVSCCVTTVRRGRQETPRLHKVHRNKSGARVVPRDSPHCKRVWSVFSGNHFHLTVN